MNSRKRRITSGRSSSLYLRMSMSGDPRGDFRGIRGHAIAAPGDVHIGSQQDEIEAVEIARYRIANIEHGERRLHCPLQRRYILVPEAKQRIAARRDAILDRDVTVEPHLRQARTRPRGGNVSAEVIFG